METANISKAIISITSPGTHLKTGDDELARKITRYCNAFAADLKKRRPDQFGFWASLPLPDVKGSLDEIAHAGEELNADGYALETNHGGSYLGDKAFDAVFEDLNKRNAIVFMHPTTPCLQTATKATPLPQYPMPMFEFFFDTARAVINLFLSGTVSRCPNITFIIPHMGGALPPLINRFSTTPALLGLPNVDPKVNAAWVKDRLNAQFYFDSAGWALPEQIHGLLPYVSVERMLYGSDFPYTPLEGVLALSQGHDLFLPGLFPKKEDQEALCVGNAKKILAQKAI